MYAFLEDRIKRAIQKIEPYINEDTIQIEDFSMVEDVKWYKELSNTEKHNKFKSGQTWGGVNKNYCFSFDFIIPDQYIGKKIRVEVSTGREGLWNAVNPQFLAYVNGVLIQGLDVNHRVFSLIDHGVAGERYHVDLIAWSGMSEGPIELEVCITAFNEEVERLYYDIKVPYDVLLTLEKGSKDSEDILEHLNAAVNLLDFRSLGSDDFYHSILDALKYMQGDFYHDYCGRHNDIEICALGHTHIDVAWLWTLENTEQKTVRSFSTALQLMEEDPEYIFMSSQPQLYQYMKENCPQGYQKIKERIEEGRWEADGAMWLEADCNLSSGESLIRQIIYGKRFFKEEFNVDSKILWLPDVFGYSAALPQILMKCGVDYFMTTKISWNEINKMPYDTFMWEGIDGTPILSYFITTSDYKKNHQGVTPNHFTTYNGMMTPIEMKGTWDRYQQKGLTNEVLSLYGYGDGGGGTTKEMIETRKRLSYGIPGCPKVKVDTARKFFDRLNNRVKDNKRLPKWVGELYLEQHRGTYTSMSRNKKYNRKSEFAYSDVEFLSVLCHLLIGERYPKSLISEGWHTILLNQFHDILPGTSIKEVYDESKIQYEEALVSADQMIRDSVERLCQAMKLDAKSVVVFNQLSFIRDDLVEFELPEEMKNVAIFKGKKEMRSQRSHDGKFIFLAEGVPAKGYCAYEIQPVKSNNDAMNLFEGVLESDQVVILFDEVGDIVAIYDKINEREVLKEKKVPNLQAFHDMARLGEKDNWQIAAYYNEKMWPVEDLVEMRMIESGEVRKVLRIEKRFMDSRIIQDVVVYNHTSRIDFKTFIDWKEKDILLKAAFDVDVYANNATYEIQYGNVERPTYVNTSWDAAKFEVCAHKWADISESQYGVSLLNDCKYGHDIKDGLMRLSLLKSTCYPNPEMDKEKQSFTYSLYPHKGDWRFGETQKSAYMVNCPLYSSISNPKNGHLESAYSFITLDKENVIVEVVKQAEDTLDIVIRLYEFEGARVVVNGNFGVKPISVHECDMLETDIQELEVYNQRFEFTMKPYEIKTFKIKV